MTTTPGGPRVRLRPLRDDDERAVRAAQVAMAADGFDFDFVLGPDPHLPWAGYLRRLADTRAGVALPPGPGRRRSSAEERPEALPAGALAGGGIVVDGVLGHRVSTKTSISPASRWAAARSGVRRF